MNNAQGVRSTRIQYSNRTHLRTKTPVSCDGNATFIVANRELYWLSVHNTGTIHNAPGQHTRPLLDTDTLHTRHEGMHSEHPISAKSAPPAEQTQPLRWCRGRVSCAHAVMTPSNTSRLAAPLVGAIAVATLVQDVVNRRREHVPGTKYVRD